jgi:uncharacterized protein
MRFICDSTLGKLTKHLRMLGFDAIFTNSLDTLNRYKNSADPPLFFTKRKKAISYQPAIFVEKNKIDEQIEEIENYIRPYINANDFMTRCIECNTLLEPIEKEDIEARVPEYIYHHHEEFKVCTACKKVYWQGTHAEQMKKWTGGLKHSNNQVK